MKKRVLKRVLSGVVLLLLISAVQGLAREFDIPAGPLAGVVQAYSDLTGRQLIYLDDIMAGKSSPGVKGDFSRDEALDAILKGTGVEFTLTSQDTVVLKKSAASAGGPPAKQIPDTGKNKRKPPLQARKSAEAPAPLSFGTLVVTGEKMDRSLHETLSAVTVLTPEEIGGGDRLNIEDISDRVPNVVNSAVGGMSIRGVDGAGATLGAIGYVTGARPKVSTRIDGISEHWAGYTFVQGSLWDIEQLEVLRGPQSTTQGRNTIGGALVLRTNDPGFENESALRGGIKSTDGNLVSQLAGMVSGPLVKDTLAGRFTLERIAGNGFINYRAQGTDNTGSPYTYPWDPSEIENLNLKGKLLFMPESIPELSVLTTLSRRTAKGEYLNYVSGVEDEVIERYELITPGLNTRYQDSAVNALAVASAWSMDDMAFHLDYALSDHSVSFDEYAGTTTLDQDETSHELEARMVLDPAQGRLSGVAGLYYFHRDKELFVPGFFTVPFDDIDTWAAYADLTYALTPSLDLVMGARAERESQDRDVTFRGTRFTADLEDTVFLPKLGLNYKFGPLTNMGILARKGYSPGGASVDWVGRNYYEYDKEEVVTLEVSGRRGFWDNQAFLSVSLFYNLYDDYQAFTENRNDFADTVFGTVNIKEVETYGVELEARAHIFTGMAVFGSVGVMDSKVTDSYENYEKLAGNKLGVEPDLNLNLGFTHRIMDHWSWGADATYVGKYFAYVENDEIATDQNNAKNKTSGDYLLVNLHLRYTAMGGRLSFLGYVKNVFDELVILKKWDNRTQVGSPMSAGLVLEYRF